MDRLAPIHPGEVLWEDFMKPLGLSQYRVAKDMGVPQLRISQIIKGKRAVTADTAMRLARYFGTSAEVWLRLQARYDLEMAEAADGERIDQQVKPLEREPTLEELIAAITPENRHEAVDWGAAVGKEVW